MRKNSIFNDCFFYMLMPFCLILAFMATYSIALKIKAYIHDEIPNSVPVSLVDSPKETKNLEVRDKNEQGKRK